MYMQTLGYVDGSNVRYAPRSSYDAAELPKLAASIAELSPAVVYANGDEPARVAARQWATTPIVAMTDDHIGAGLTDSYAHPSRNITGISRLEAELDTKRLEILHELVPPARVILVLRDPQTAWPERGAELDRAARSIGIELFIRDIGENADIDVAVAAGQAAGVTALLVLGSPLLTSPQFEDHIRQAAISSRLPAMMQIPSQANRLGNLASYGADQDALLLRLAQMIDRILKGAKPDSLPIEQPTKFRLIVNLKTANAIGLEVPPAILVARRRGDRMRRVFLWLMLLAAPLGHSHAAERVFRLGELGTSAATLEYMRKVTLPELAKLGFEEGRNLILDERAGGADAVDRLARELVQNKPDAIIATGGDAIRAASQATSTVPIVVFGAVPRGEGAPASFARPGGNVTGVVILGPELDGKRLELLHEAVPGARRIAGLFVPWGMYRDQSEREMRKVADSSGLSCSRLIPKGRKTTHRRSRRCAPPGRRRSSSWRMPICFATGTCSRSWRCKPACPRRANGAKWPAPAVCWAMGRVCGSCSGVWHTMSRIFLTAGLRASCRSSSRRATNSPST